MEEETLEALAADDDDDDDDDDASLILQVRECSTRRRPRGQGAGHVLRELSRRQTAPVGQVSIPRLLAIQDPQSGGKKGKGKGFKGKSTGLAQRIANSACRPCGQTGKPSARHAKHQEVQSRTRFRPPSW